MKQLIFLSPISVSPGLHSVSLGFVEALQKSGKKAFLLRPLDVSLEISRLLKEDKEDELINAYITEISLAKESIVVLEGLVYKDTQPYAGRFNSLISKALGANVVLVTTPGNKTVEETLDECEIEKDNFTNVAGVILNKVGAPTDEFGHTRMDLFDPPQSVVERDDILGFIPWNRSLMATDTNNIIKQVGADIINEETAQNHKVENFLLAAASEEVALKHVKDHTLVITSGDRTDIVVGCCNLYLTKGQVSGLLLTAGEVPSKETLAQCSEAQEKGLPIFCVETDSLRTSIALQKNPMIIDKDMLINYIASNIDLNQLKLSPPPLLPSTFRYDLIKKAKALNKTILLPEGDDFRIREAANQCADKLMAKVILFTTQREGLNANIKVIDPSSISQRYISDLIELRKHKGMDEKKAQKALEDPMMVAMMMLKKDEVDGIVAGAATTTADVISPALKVIKTAKDATLVSSVFFMCLDSEVLIYGDCAINLDPTAEGLADIAIQSAETAKKFGIDPKVALISYSTGSSGSGKAVEKVKEAAKIVKEKRPDIACDGPLQYDAAKVPEVAAQKAPESPVAGKANVFIFPDLNTANTTYKAVQRSANAISIGPMLQGLGKPVNDLSRGAKVEDILYTIAITAIQAKD